MSAAVNIHYYISRSLTYYSAAEETHWSSVRNELAQTPSGWAEWAALRQIAMEVKSLWINV